MSLEIKFVVIIDHTTRSEGELELVEGLIETPTLIGGRHSKVEVLMTSLVRGIYGAFNYQVCCSSLPTL